MKRRTPEDRAEQLLETTIVLVFLLLMSLLCWYAVNSIGDSPVGSPHADTATATTV